MFNEIFVYIIRCCKKIRSKNIGYNSTLTRTNISNTVLHNTKNNFRPSEST